MRILVCFVIALFAMAGFNEGLKLISTDGMWFWMGIATCTGILCLVAYIIVLIGFGASKQVNKDESVSDESKN